MLTDGRSRGRAARWCDRVATAEGRLAPHACAARDAVPRARRAMRGAVGACWPSSDGPSSGVQSASGRAHGSYPAVLATVDHRAGAGAGRDLDDRGRGWGWGQSPGCRGVEAVEPLSRRCRGLCRGLSRSVKADSMWGWRRGVEVGVEAVVSVEVSRCRGCRGSPFCRGLCAPVALI